MTNVYSPTELSNRLPLLRFLAFRNGDWGVMRMSVSSLLLKPLYPTFAYDHTESQHIGCGSSASLICAVRLFLSALQWLDALIHVVNRQVRTVPSRFLLQVAPISS